MIDARLIERVFVLIAILGPLAGLIIGVMLGALKKCAMVGMFSGFLLGLLGICAYGFWRIYGIITNGLGLDSVANLIIEIALFAFAGVIIGFAVYKISILIKRLWAARPSGEPLER